MMIEQSYRGFIMGMFVADRLARQRLNTISDESDTIEDAFKHASTSVSYKAELEQNPLVALIIGVKYPQEALPKAHSVVSSAYMHLSQLAQSQVEPVKYMEAIWEHCSGQNTSFDATLRKIGHVLGFGSASHAMRLLKTTDQDATVFTTALYCIMRYPDDFSSAIDCALKAPTQAHLTVMIVGAIVGLHIGEANIDSAWRDEIISKIDVQKYTDYLTRTN